jgi:hypothetical protein
LVELGRRDAAQQQLGLLIVLLLARRIDDGSAVAELADELAVFRELEQRVAGRCAADPDMTFSVDENGVLEPGQPGTAAGSPHACSRLPSMSNAITAGGFVQQRALGGFSDA